MTDSIQQIGLRGVQSGLKDAADHAQKLSSGFESDSTDTVGEIIGLKQAQNQVYASTKVIKVGNELDKAVLDIIA
jgi:hypothetical protein